MLAYRQTAHASQTSDHLFDTYQELEEVAQALGFATESSLIARRRDAFSHPYLLVVAGSAGSGKSAVINQLAGAPVAPVGVSRPWIDLYCRFPGRYPYAVVYRRSQPDEGEILSVENARVLAARAGSVDEPGILGIERIVWYVDAPALPEHVMLAEAPAGRPELLPPLYGQADAVLVAIRADTLRSRDVPPIDAVAPSWAMPALGVVTHMDRVPRNRWPTVLRRAGAHPALPFESIVPFALEQGSSGESYMTTPLRREVRNRFFSCAPDLRRKNHSRFVEAMRRDLACKFEAYVDRMLTARWLHYAYQRSAEQALSQHIADATQRVQHFLVELTTWARLRAQERENGWRSGRSLAQYTPLPLNVFFRRIEEDLIYEARQILVGTPLAEEGTEYVAGRSTSSAESMPAASPRLKLPAPPLFPLAVLRGDISMNVEYGAPARHFVPETAQLDHTSIPQHAALWQPAEEWIAGVSARAANALSAWLQSLKDTVTAWLKEHQVRLFRSVHGVRPDDVPETLLRMETAYVRLQGRSVVLRTPHLRQGWMTPVLFALNCQNDAFVQGWNRAVVHDSFGAAAARVEARLNAQLERLGDAAVAAWNGREEMLEKALRLAWSRIDTKQILRDRVQVPAKAAADVLQGVLDLPAVADAGRSALSAVPRPEGISAFLGRNSESFLAPTSRRDRHTPECAMVQVLKQAVSDEAERLWSTQGEVPVRLNVRRTLMGGVIASMLGLASTTGAWLALFGPSNVTLLLLTLAVLGALSGFGTSRRLKQRMADKMGDYSRAVHRSLSERLASRFRQLQRCVSERASAAGFPAEVEAALGLGQARAVALYVGYGDLVRRVTAAEEAGYPFGRAA